MAVSDWPLFHHPHLPPPNPTTGGLVPARRDGESVSIVSSSILVSWQYQCQSVVGGLQWYLPRGKNANSPRHSWNNAVLATELN